MSSNTEFDDEVSSFNSSKDHSVVWNYFDKLPVGKDGVRKGKCKACEKVYKADKGTSNLKRHVPKCFDMDEPGPPRKRAPLDQAMYREKVAYTIIKHNYPFSYLEHEATRKLHRFLHGDVIPISRNTAKADVLKIYDREKTNLKEKLQNVTSRICLTADLWSSITTDGYMALTAHYIDENWVIRKNVLNIRVIPPPHSGKLLANHLHLNNALVCGGEFTHVRCCAHVLNLIVQGGLKVIEGAIDKCGKHVRQDIVTRWISIYLMLESALAYRKAYARLALVDSSYKTYPSDEEWTRVETIANFLKPFYNITTLFSGSSYPTSNLYFHNVWKIQKCIEEEIDNVDKVISTMAKEMKIKFNKYWESYSMILSFAAVLDPRYKFKVVEFCFRKLNMTYEERKKKLETIFNGLHKLYDEEYSIFSKASSSTGECSNIGVDPSDDLDGFESFESEYKNVEIEKSQLDMYLDEPSLDRKEKLDVLQYWKENQGRYPQLSLMARDILSIPITTVASESSFSIGGRVLSKYQASLLSSNVEALLCTRDWLFGLEDEDENEMEEELVEDIEALYSTHDGSHV